MQAEKVAWGCRGQAKGRGSVLGPSCAAPFLGQGAGAQDASCDQHLLRRLIAPESAPGCSPSPGRLAHAGWGGIPQGAAATGLRLEAPIPYCPSFASPGRSGPALAVHTGSREWELAASAPLPTPSTPAAPSPSCHAEHVRQLLGAVGAAAAAGAAGSINLSFPVNISCRYWMERAANGTAVQPMPAAIAAGGTAGEGDIDRLGAGLSGGGTRIRTTPAPGCVPRGGRGVLLSLPGEEEGSGGGRGDRGGAAVGDVAPPTWGMSPLGWAGLGPAVLAGPGDEQCRGAASAACGSQGACKLCVSGRQVWMLLWVQACWCGCVGLGMPAWGRGRGQL